VSKIVLSDSFARSVANGFGNADTGQVWTLGKGTASEFSVDGSKAIIASLASDWQYVSGASQDVDVTLTVAFNQLPNSGIAKASVMLRVSSDGLSSYEAVFQVSNGGGIDAVLRTILNGFSASVVNSGTIGTYVAGDLWNIRVQLSGKSPTNYAVKLWAFGDSEPSDWAISGSDNNPTLQVAGGFGLHSGTSTATNVGFETHFDDLTAIDVLSGVVPVGGAGEASQSGPIAIEDSIVLAPASGKTLAGRDFTQFDYYMNELGLIAFEVGAITASTPGMDITSFSNYFGIHTVSSSVQLRPVRTDTGQSPYEQRPETGDIFAQGDFSHGMGQVWYHRQNADPRMYLWSDGFDITVPPGQDSAGTLKHLDQMAAAHLSGTIGTVCIFNGFPFVIDGVDVYRGDGFFPGTWTSEDPSVAEGDVTVHDLATNGDVLFAALGANGIHQRSTSGTWSHYSDALATLLAWCKDRLMASDGRSLYEITAGGLAPAAILTTPNGWTITNIFEAGAFIYACAVNATAGLSRIYVVGLNSDASALEEKDSNPIPNGELIYAGVGYLNQSYLVGGIHNSAGGYDPILYQGVPDSNGSLQLLKIAEGVGAGALDLAGRAGLPMGESCAMAWSQGSSNPYGAREGLLTYQLGTGAQSGYLKKETPAASPNPITSMAFYRGRVLFVVKGDGLYYQDVTKLTAKAQLITSGADWSNAGDKIWDLYQLAHKALPVGTSVLLEFTEKHPDEAVWQTAIDSNVAGAVQAKERLTAVTSPTLTVRITSNANSAASVAPEVISFWARSHPTLSPPEYELIRYIRIFGEDRSQQNGEPIFQDPDSIRRQIEDLCYQWVSWFEPYGSWTARITSIEDMTPIIAALAATAGMSRQDGYLLGITMQGTRDA